MKYISDSSGRTSGAWKFNELLDPNLRRDDVDLERCVFFGPTLASLSVVRIQFELRERLPPCVILPL
ncbi:MAG: hypothetical protein KZQ84_08840 [Candidatus Thiodiazotropha sp. (ex Lucinoma borealis)]|nr:hypothetical protein [Candidatus Thiodiazotropha sp. (ex Lucinoma borealis)]